MIEADKTVDVIILGSGPAGLQAAVHGGRSKASVAVLGRIKRSSLYKAHVENYCCIDGIVSGQEILEKGRVQAAKSGALLMDLDVVDFEKVEDGRILATLESGDRLLGSSLILAMGISRNRLNVPGEKELLGKGVSYCIDCDANFFRTQPVVVVGDESAAFYGALHLLMIANEVHLVYQEAAVSDPLLYQVEKSGVIRHPGRKVKAIHGDKEVRSVQLDDGSVIQTTGVFIELGAKGALELALKLDVALDSSMKYIEVNKKQETNIPGVYAAGDICGPPWQMAKAVGEGCVAGMEAAAYAKRRRPHPPG